MPSGQDGNRRKDADTVRREELKHTHPDVERLGSAGHEDQSTLKEEVVMNTREQLRNGAMIPHAKCRSIGQQDLHSVSNSRT
jgi:hypothetical protein